MKTATKAAAIQALAAEGATLHFQRWHVGGGHKVDTARLRDTNLTGLRTRWVRYSTAQQLVSELNLEKVSGSSCMYKSREAVAA